MRLWTEDLDYNQFQQVGEFSIENYNHQLFYWLFTCAGVCSAYHHSSPHSWTIVIDWLPISISILLGLYEGIFWTVQPVTLFKVSFAFSVLLADHWWTPTPVPWGHVMWHLLAAYSFDEVYQDFIYEI